MSFVWHHHPSDSYCIESETDAPSHELLLILPMILHGFAREAEPRAQLEQAHPTLIWVLPMSAVQQ